MSLADAKINISLVVPENMAGKRLDQVASELISDYSRSRLQSWIKDGALTLDGRVCRARDKLVGGERLVLEADPEPEPQSAWLAEDMPLEIVYEDQSLLAINKPAGLVVHPAAGNRGGTLLNGLLSYLPQLETVPRAGIVHRLDKDTTGLMVVAKTLQAHTSLVRQLQARAVSREYQALVRGVMTGGGTVSGDIGRHPRTRTKMAVVEHGGKEAITHYRVAKRFDEHTYIRVSLETGRTHQIRVHMAYIGYPLVGDAVYGGRLKLPKGAGEQLTEVLRDFKRQALHAASLALVHPDTGERVSWRAAAPPDMQTLLAALDHAQHA